VSSSAGDVVEELLAGDVAEQVEELLAVHQVEELLAAHQVEELLAGDVAEQVRHRERKGRIGFRCRSARFVAELSRRSVAEHRELKGKRSSDADTADAEVE